MEASMMGYKIHAGFLAAILLVATQIAMTQEVSTPAGHIEGIKVHGSWMIELRNPDGTVASTHKFENSLVAGGSTFLVLVLAKQKSVQYWQIRLMNKDGGVCSRGTTHVDCGILDSALTPDVSSDFA